MQHNVQKHHIPHIKQKYLHITILSYNRTLLPNVLKKYQT